MQLKLLIVPSLVVLSLVIAIGFIQPDFAKLRTQRQALEMQRQEVQKIQSIEQGIQSMDQAIQSNTELVAFLDLFYPERMDQERAVDALNYLASQAGVILSGLELAQVKEEKAEESRPEIPLTSASASVAGGGAALSLGQNLVAVSSYEPPTPKAYIAKIKAQGDYPNLRDFLNRLSAFNRLGEINSFAIRANETEEADQAGESNPSEDGAPGEAASSPAPSASGPLEARAEVRFPYLLRANDVNALHVPVFSQGSLDFAPAQAAKERAENVVPVLSKGTPGKPNPFQ